MEKKVFEALTKPSLLKHINSVETINDSQNKLIQSLKSDIYFRNSVVDALIDQINQLKKR